jgi:hypothetical protein
MLGHKSSQILRGGFFPAVLLSVLCFQSGCVGVAGHAGSDSTNPPTTFSLSGKLSPTAGGAGATVKLAGVSAATTVSDSSGNFTFNALPNGIYTVNPSNSGYTFSPASMIVTVSGANVSGITSVATAVQSAYTMTGTAGTAAATVALSGSASATTTADASGSYNFTALANGSYTVTPSKAGFTFNPASQSVTVSGGNITVAAFAATAVPSTFSISGSITTAANSSGATITLSGASSATTTANSSGNFSFTGLVNGAYIVTPSKAGFTFNPASQSVTVSGGNVTVAAFAATALTYSISGSITPSASGSGATVTLGGAAVASTTADSSGNFSFSGLANGTYAVTPDKTGFAFSPTVQGVTITSANATGINFTVSTVSSTFSISGSITPSASGSGATVTLGDAAVASTTADSSGNFTFTGLADGNYTVMPSSSSATFSPANQSITVNGHNVAGVNFNATSVLFYDDFLGTTLDSAWMAMNRHGDYSNSELQCYLPANVTISGGFLTITSLVQNQTCGDSTHSPSSWNYTSGMIQWNSLNFTYGTVEYRAKFAGGQGTWPAIWLLGYNCQASNVQSADNISPCNWPAAGSNEIDITEIKNGNFTQPWQNVVNPAGNWITCQPTIADVTQNYHVYDFTWTSTSLTWSVDGVQTCKVTDAGYIPSTPMFLIINTAIGGNGGGTVIKNLPQPTSVDYIKVTQP